MEMGGAGLMPGEMEVPMSVQARCLKSGNHFGIGVLIF